MTMAQLERAPSAEFLSDDDIALVTAAEAAPRLGVSPVTIRRWKQKEWLQVHGWTRRGEPLFSLRELWDVEHATRNGRGRRRSA